MPQTPGATSMHPALVQRARLLPYGIPLGPRSARWMTWLARRLARRRSTAQVTIGEVSVPGLDGSGAIRVRTYTPAGLDDGGPAVLWIHGGGLVLGAPEGDDTRSLAIAARVGVRVVSVDYRLAVDAPYPAAIDDCEAVLRWLHAGTSSTRRVVVAGESAGGGLAAALAARAADAALPVALQVLIYPMLDDRTVHRTDVDPRSLRLWSQANNRFGWTTYVGEGCGGRDVPADAAPARREDLSGLAPAWIGVGTADLFFQEDVTYAQRLQAAGVPCTLRVVQGAFHGFEPVMWGTPFVEAFTGNYLAAITEALGEPHRAARPTPPG